MQQMIKKIKTGPLQRAYLVHGSETVWREAVLDALRDRVLKEGFSDWNWAVFYGSKNTEAGFILEELATAPWGGGSKVVAVMDAESVPSSVMETVVRWLHSKEQANSLALFYNKLDNRLKYVKMLKEFAVEIKCEPLQGESLIRYIMDYCYEQGKVMKRAVCQLFVDKVGSNLLFVHNELDKLLTLAHDEPEITMDHVQSITSLAPSELENNTVFRLTDFISQRKRSEALNALKVLIDGGESPMRILPLIERQLRLILAAKTRTTSIEETARQMGENSSYPLKKTEPFAQNFTMDELLAGFEAVVGADREMKLGVRGDKVLEELIVKLTK